MKGSREKNIPSQESIWNKIKQGLHFLTSVIMYAIFLILIFIAILFVAYFIDQKRNIASGENKPPLFNAYVIISPSMFPTIKVEDAIVIKRVPEERLKKGDIITFNSTDYRYSGVTVTHRIVGIEKTKDGKTLYTTKGDNNNTTDSTRISYDSIFGKVIFKIPKIGYLQYFLTQSWGWVAAVVVPCLGIIIYDIIKLIKTIQSSVVPSKGKKQEKKEPKEKDKRKRFK